MKCLAPICLLFVFSFCSTRDTGNVRVENHREMRTPALSAPVAVLELFTSEGCSSCPPADKLLSEISQQSEEGQNNIIALSFHVHYWDRLGWSDPYSDKRYSDRQRLYASKMKINRVYTPQLIVNGTEAFVGSDKKEADKAIAKAEAEMLPITISITEKAVQGNQCTFTYQLSDAPKNAIINFALTEDGLSQQVGRGENRGKLLRHDNVVRSFLTKDEAKKTGEVSLRIPQGADLTQMNIVAYVQRDDDFKVLGAVSDKVPQP